MFNAEEYIAKYQEIEPGPARLKAIREAIQAADEAKNAEWSFRFRDRAMRESTFEADDVDSMVIFPEMMALYDNHEELQLDDDYQHMLMWDFKWMLINSVDFPQIPLEKIREFYEEFRKRLTQYGKSLRPYYYLLEDLADSTGTPLPEGVKFGRYRMEPEDDLNDCHACEASHDVRIDLLTGHRDAALKHSERIFSGELSCAEVPQTTYGTWINYDIDAGEYDHAKQMAKHLFPLLRGNMDMSLLQEIGAVLRLYSITDRHLGTELFRRSLRSFMASRNPWQRMQYAIGAFRLFDRMQSDEVNLILPRDFVLWNDTYTYKSAELAEYFFNEAKSLAERFDKRNGNTINTDKLYREDPEYDAEAIDLIHGDAAEQEPSVMGALYGKLPEGVVTVDGLRERIDASPLFKLAQAAADEERGVIMMQIITTDGSEDVYRVAVTVQPAPDIEDFRPASMVSSEETEATKDAEGVILFIMPFEDKQPDLALHQQIRIMHLVCPDAVTYLDFTRMKLLPAGWVKLEAESDVPPLVDYLYNLRLAGDQRTNAVWISTRGLAACGMRDMEILDATTENYARYCDLMAFAVEGRLLRGEMPDADTPFTVLRKNDNSQVRLVWLPASKAGAEYDKAHSAGVKLRSDRLGDGAEAFEQNGIFFLYDGENADGTTRRKLLSEITTEEFDKFCYGAYVNTSKKIAALAKERYGLFCRALPEASGKAYVCITVEGDQGEDEIWSEVTSADENGIECIFTADCAAGREGDTWHADLDSLTDFSVTLGEIRITPNTAYAIPELLGEASTQA